MKPILPPAANTLDPNGLAGLKRAAKEGAPSPATLKQVAQQFEALFMQMMLKSMREASFGDDLFESDQGNFYRDMYDQQLALTLAKQQGIGITDVLVRQLGGSRATGSGGASTLDTVLASVQRQLQVSAADTAATRDPQAFARALWPHVERAGRNLGVAPEAILSVAALETGWGSAAIRQADGSNAYNYFGIKAGSDWPGARVSAATREYLDGQAVTRKEQFRAYGSIGEGVADFVRFVRDNPRYRAALGQNDPQAFVAALADAGYATDPDYARKAGAILAGDTLRNALQALKFSGPGPLPA